MRDIELAAVKASLDESWWELRNWLVIAAGYLEAKAEEGESLAGFPPRSPRFPGAYIFDVMPREPARWPEPNPNDGRVPAGVWRNIAMAPEFVDDEESESDWDPDRPTPVAAWAPFALFGH